MKHMPRKGHRSITVRDEVYDTLWEIWQNRKEEYLKEGITSFSGFVTKFLYNAIKLDKKHTERS